MAADLTPMVQEIVDQLGEARQHVRGTDVRTGDWLDLTALRRVHGNLGRFIEAMEYFRATGETGVDSDVVAD